MKIIRKIKKKLGIIPDNQTDEIMEERSKIKKTMAKNLKNIGFNQDEINEVLDILTECEKNVQIKKDELIGTNINNDYTMEIMKKIFDEIRQIELKAASDVKAKIVEINQRKSVKK